MMTASVVIEYGVTSTTASVGMFTAAAFSDPPKLRVKKDRKEGFHELSSQVTDRNASAYSTFDRVPTGGSVNIPIAAGDPAMQNMTLHRRLM